MTKMFKIDEPLFISNIDDDTKQLNMFERYIVTEHNRKIETFEKFKRTIIDEHIKKFCDQLTDSMTHTLVKYIFAEYCPYLISVNEVYDRSLRDVFTQNITDFKIKLPTKTIPCLRIVLEQSSFFKMMFEEFNNVDEITLDLDMYELIIKMLYKVNITEFISVNNFIETFMLVDKCLLDMNYTIELIPFLEENYIEIMNGNSHDDIITITNLLKNIVNITDNTKVNMIRNKIVKHYFKDNIFVIADWPTIFTEEEKIKAIEMSEQYDLLNMSQISPKEVIKLLEITDLTDIWDIYSILQKKNVIIHFHNNINGRLHSSDTNIIIIIDEYYPNFKATIFVKTDIVFDNTSYNYVPYENIFEHE